MQSSDLDTESEFEFRFELLIILLLLYNCDLLAMVLRDLRNKERETFS